VAGKNRKTSVIKEPFVAIYIALLKDPSFRKLRNSSKVLYVYLRSKFNLRTFNEVTLAYSEIDFMSSRTISAAFKELQKKGFIKKVSYGGLKGCGGSVSKYKFIGPFKHFYYKGYMI
jgi:hypothetical protein